VKYEILFNAKFQKQQDCEDMYDLLLGKKGLAFIQGGDFLTIETSLEKQYGVNCNYVINKKSDRDKLFDEVKVKGDATINQGDLKAIKWRHDEGLPCELEKEVRWGDPDEVIHV